MQACSTKATGIIAAIGSLFGDDKPAPPPTKEIAEALKAQAAENRRVYLEHLFSKEIAARNASASARGATTANAEKQGARRPPRQEPARRSKEPEAPPPPVKERDELRAWGSSGARHQEHVLRQPGRDASSLLFLIMLEHLIGRLKAGVVVQTLLNCPLQEEAFGNGAGDECVDRVLVAGAEAFEEVFAPWRRHGAPACTSRYG
jgi:hypothetical protein